MFYSRGEWNLSTKTIPLMKTTKFSWTVCTSSCRASRENVFNYRNNCENSFWWLCTVRYSHDLPVETGLIELKHHHKEATKLIRAQSVKSHTQFRTTQRISYYMLILQRSEGAEFHSRQSEDTALCLSLQSLTNFIVSLKSHVDLSNPLTANPCCEGEIRNQSLRTVLNIIFGFKVS